MRTRKRKGHKPAAVTFTEKDIIALCRKKAVDVGLDVGEMMYLKLTFKEEKSKVEVEIPLKGDPA